MTDLELLLEKVRTATAGSRELDAYLHALLDGRTIRETDIGQILARNSRGPHDEYVLGTIDPGKQSRNFSIGWSDPPTPRYTTSLDAIAALIGREMPGWWWLREDGQSIRLVGPDNGDCYPSSVGRHHLVPLALCAAFLSALISKEKADG